jgi:hypothetical protein
MEKNIVGLEMRNDDIGLNILRVLTCNSDTIKLWNLIRKD